MPLLTPIKESSKKPSEWLLNSDFPTSLSYAIGMRRASRDHYQKPIALHEHQISTSPRHPDDDYPILDSPNEVMEEEVNEVTTTNFATRLKIQFLKAFGIDGLNTTTNKITCADGMVASYSSNSLPLRFVITSLLGMPNRPETIIDGVPQLSFKQFLRNWIGGWTPLRAQKYTWIENTYPERVEEGYQKLWTTKNIVQIFAIPFKIAILLFKIFTLPFKILLNAVKLVTEFALPLISFYTAVLNTKVVQGIGWLHEKALEKEQSESSEQKWIEIDDETISTGYTDTHYSKWKIGLFIFGLIPMVIVTLAVMVFQYATVLLCRAGRALTSPAESARRAYALGRSFQIGEKGSKLTSAFSHIMGILGLVISLGVSALLWTLTLPFALSTVTTWIPSLINAINWIAQLPAVSATLTWISSSSLATGSMVLLNNLFATVGTALSAAFGTAITAMAGVISVQVPAVVLAVGTTLGMLAMPVAALLSLGADKLSNLWAQWTAGNPLRLLFASGNSGKTRDDSLVTPLVTLGATVERTPKFSASPTQNPRHDIKFDKWTDSLHQYRIDGDVASFVVSPIALDLVYKNNHLKYSAELKGRGAELAYGIAANPHHGSHGYYRLPTREELSTYEVEEFRASQTAPDF